jgi:ATP-dependent RNA helicase DeaD
MNTFKSLGLNDTLLQAITDLGFEIPSEVQEKTIPILLEKDIDLVALAQTGTGKTAAFGFPMLQKIDIGSRTTQGLILSPTRELCMQITNELKLYGKYEKGLNVVAIYGGASIQDQAKQVQKGAQIIVATPGRMKDMISRRILQKFCPIHLMIRVLGCLVQRCQEKCLQSLRSLCTIQLRLL